MQKPKDYDEVKATGEYTPLEAGGYVCKIIGVEETTSRNGRDMIKIAIDIAEGDEADRFTNEYKANTKEDKKWPNAGMVYQLTHDNEGKTHGRFKQFTECVVESNKGFEIAWGNDFADCFKGKLIGALFGREQWETQEGDKRWSTKIRSFKAVEDIRNGNFSVPKDRPLEDDKAKNSVPSGFESIDDEDMPF